MPPRSSLQPVARPGLGYLVCMRGSQVRFAHHGTTWPTMAHHGTTMAHHGTTWHIMAHHGTTWHNIAQHCTTWHIMAQHGTSWHNIAQHGTSWHITAQHGTTLHNMAHHGTTWHNNGTTWHIMAHHGTTWHNHRLENGGSLGRGAPAANGSRAAQGWCPMHRASHGSRAAPAAKPPFSRAVQGRAE